MNIISLTSTQNSASHFGHCHDSKPVHFKMGYGVTQKGHLLRFKIQSKISSLNLFFITNDGMEVQFQVIITLWTWLDMILRGGLNWDKGQGG